MSITRNFNLYLTAGRTIPLVINVNQYDQGETWVFTLYNDDGTQYVPSTGAIVGIKSDGNLIANAGTVNESGQVVITETEQMTASAGKAVFELQLDSETHGTANFIVLVEKDPSDGGTVSGSDIGLLRQALDGGLSQSAIDALLACFANVAWINANGQTYYDALEDALNAVRGIYLDANTLAFSTIGSSQQLTATTVPAGGTVSWQSSNTSVATVSSSGLVTSAGYGTATITASSGDVSATCSVSVIQATLVSITAVYTQSGTVYDNASLDDLKTDLVVTAYYDNSTTATVPSADYTLSGTLAEGTSTITVTYGGKTDTFTVTVTAEPAVYKLTNRTFANDGSVDTGIAYLTTDKSFTIMCDVDFAGQQSNQTWVLFKMMNATSPYAGVAVTPVASNSNYLMCQWMTAKSGTGGTSDVPLSYSYVGNVKIVFTHEVGSGKMTYYVKVGSNAVVSATRTSTYTAITTDLAIGGNLSNTQPFNGTVNSFVLYDSVKSSAEINDFLS